MTADENAAIVRRGYAAFNSGDVNALSELFDENAVWHAPGRSSLAVTTRDATQRWATSAGWGRRQAATSGPNCST
jgi:ketosteroid isomerase-like protein